ncbi:glycosyltransferase [Saccharicrinis aurantiacus]|uniref:glycosyltransferase n=1 Tax=Saccharicrinis aurantiacus TaxID=1849719 RepID=UPI00094F9F06|nr:glycosyltransferase [Saccharicrinis aurantiacus]
MLNLLYDLSATQPTPEASFHGGSEYSKYIFFEAIKRRLKFDVCLNSNFGVHPEIEEALEKHDITVNYFVNNQELKHFIEGADYHRFYSGMPYRYEDFYFKNVKFYMTIHGLRELEMHSLKELIPYVNNPVSKVMLLLKHLLGYNKNVQQSHNSLSKLLSIKNKHIITVSKHSLYSICNFFPDVKPDEITVCNSPLDLTKYKYENNNEGKYFLLVSGNRWIKNNYRAIKAIDALYENRQVSQIKTIVLGCNDIDFSKDVVHKDMFTFLPYVSKKELEIYFQNAFAFIYPTLNEGFGYPPLQAMKYEVPVLASAISSVPEVCKQAALYFNPFSISEISNRILQIVNDRECRAMLIKEGNYRVNTLRKEQELMLKNMVDTIFL